MVLDQPSGRPRETGPCPATGKATAIGTGGRASDPRRAPPLVLSSPCPAAARRAVAQRSRQRSRPCPRSCAARSPGTRARWPPHHSPSPPACRSTSATPTAPGSAARNENTNGLLRQYFPKGTAPVPASSGGTQRHRLARTGNRQLNAALHRIALTQTRCHPPARAYRQKRHANGDSSTEATRALKRQLSDVVLPRPTRRRPPTRHPTPTSRLT